jgi:hypothetical protein
MRPSTKRALEIGLICYGKYLESHRSTSDDDVQRCRGVRTGDARPLSNLERGEGLHHGPEESIHCGERKEPDRGGRCRDRQGARPYRRGSLGFRIAALFTLILPAISLGGVWNDIVNAAKGVGNAVIGFVEKAVNWVVHGLTYDMHLIHSAWSAAVDAVLTELHQDEKVLSWVYDHVAHEAESGVNDVLSVAEAYAEQGLTVVSHDLSDLQGWTEDAIGDVEQGLDTLKGWVITDVWDPLASDVVSLGGDLVHGIDKVSDDIYHDFIEPIEHTAETAYNDGIKAVRWTEDEGAYVFRLVSKAESWLIWMGLHALDDLEDIPSEIQSGITTFIKSTGGQPLVSDFDNLVDALSKALG